MANLSAKELNAIQDQLGLEKTLVTKYQMYAQVTGDSKIKKQCEEIAMQHKAHYDKLFEQLN